MPGLHFDITGDNSNFLHKLEESRNGVRSTSKQIEESGMSIEQMFGRMTKAAAAFGVSIGVKELVGSITRVRGEFQQLEVAFNTMLGSKEKADTLMSQLVRTAAITPFDLQGVANGAKQLLAYGTAAEDVNGTLVRLGDIAAGLSIPLGDLVYLYGTTMTQGRLFTMDLRQFQGRGIPLADELAKQFGVAKDKVGELVTAGKVGFPEVQKAIEAMTNDGSKFGGLMEAQSKTITGQISNIEDAISTMFNEIGKENDSVINSALSGVSYLVEHWENVAIAIESAVVAYGTYKAVVMTAAALQSAEQTLKIDTEIEGLKSLLVVKEESKNADIAAAVASGRLTEAKAIELAALREELATRLAVLKLKEEEAIVEHASALSAFNTAKQASDAANERLEKMDALYQAALAQGDASYEQYAIEQLQTASANANTAATTLNTAEKNLNAASSKRKAASEAVDTMATQANTVANHANTASMNIMKLATIQLTTILKGMWATLMANPLLLVASAVAGLAFAIYKVATAENEAEKAIRMYNEALDEQQKKQEEYKEKIDSLIKTIDDNNKSEGERLQAFEALKAEYPTVLNNLLTEAEYLKDVLKYKKLIAEEDNNRAKQSDEEILEEAKRKLKYYQDVRKKGTSTTLVDMDGNGWATDNVEDAIKAQQEIVNKAIAKVASHKVSSYLENIKDMKDDDIVTVIDDINNSLKALGKSGDYAIAIVTELGGEFSKSQLSSIKSALETEQNARNTEKNTGKEWIEKYKKSYLETKDELDRFLNSESELSEIEYERKLKELTDKKDEAEKKYKASGGKITTDKQTQSEADTLRQEQEKYKLLLDKNKRDQSRAETDAQHELEQIKIDGLQEGSEKVLRQRKLNHEKELETIRREAEDRKLQLMETARSEFEADPANAKKSFDAESFAKSEPAQKQFRKIEETRDIKIKTSDIKYNRGDDLSGLLDEYKDYTDERLAIEKKFNDDIAVLDAQRRQAVKDGNAALIGQIDRAKAQATKDKGEVLMRLDYGQLKKSPEYVRAFENLKQTSTETLSSLLSQLEEAKRTAAEVLNPEDLREYTSTIQSIVDELTERNPFQTIIAKKKELARAEQELAKAKKLLDATDKKGYAILADYDEKTGETVYTYLTATEALKKYNEAKDHVIKTDGELQAAEKKVSEQVGELANALKDIGGVIGGTSGEIISLMGDIYSFTSLSIEGIGKLSSEAAKEMSALEKASVVLGIISAAIRLLQQLDSFIGDAHSQYEGYAEKIAEINKLTDAVNEYRIAALEARQAEENWFSEDNLGNLRHFRELHEEIANAYDEKANEKQAVYENEGGGGWLTSLWKPFTTLIDKTYGKVFGFNINKEYEEGTAKATDNLRIETRKKSKGFLGTGIGGKFQKTEDLVAWARKNGFGELFDEGGLINKEAGKAILEKYGDKLVGQTKETLEELLELREKYDEYIDQLHEYVNSMYEPLVDNFVDAIFDWLDTGKDALDSFRDYASDTFRNIARDMVKSLVISQIFGTGEDSFQNKINALYEQYSKGELTEEELNRKVAEETALLGKKAEEKLPVIQESTGVIMDTLERVAGIDIRDKGGSTSQSSTSGYSSVASQESIDETNGRLTGVQMGVEEIKNIMLSMLSVANLISVSVNSNSITLIEIKNLMITSNGYLEDIAGYTKKILDGFTIKLDSINRNIEKSL